MGKEKQMETRISPSGYRYYVPTKQKLKIQMPKKSWKNRLKQVLPFLGTVLKHFPHILSHGNFEKFQGFLFPGQPITYWWEIVFIIVFGILMAYTLTFKPEELD